MTEVTEIYDRIMASELFRLNGQSIDLPQALIDLCDAVMAEDDVDWCLGEFREATLDSLIVGAYWAFSEWHGGQESQTYAALCALGRVFKPGCTDGPEADSTEMDVYNTIGQWFEEHAHHVY